MATGLIGFTGFVGSNLASQYKFTDTYNSKNIQTISGKKFSLVVCAGARAEKWRINQEPDKDLAEINKLIDELKTIKADQFVLISTVDVYKNPVQVDEDTPIDTDGLHAYGSNRYYLEQFCRDHFDALIVRLPGLFGPSLKKNVIFDLLHGNNISNIHHAGSYQYYNLKYIWRDIEIALKNNLKLLNIATQPIRTDEIAAYCFDMPDFDNAPEGISAGSYDMQTKFAGVFGKSGKYIYSKKEVLKDIKDFVGQESLKK